MTSAHTTAPESARRYEVRVRGRPVSSALARALGPVQARYEPPASVLVGALDQPQLYALLEQLLTDVPMLVLDVRIVGVAAPAAASTGQDGPASHVIEFAGPIATEALAAPFGIAVSSRADRTVLSGRLDSSAVAGLLARARILGLDLLALRRAPEPATAVRVMIVDDHDGMRGVLRDLVAAAPGFELVAEAASGEQALAAAPRARPMLVLMDVQMPGIGGLAARPPTHPPGSQHRRRARLRRPPPHDRPPRTRRRRAAGQAPPACSRRTRRALAHARPK